MCALASRAAHVFVAAARERTTSLKQRPRCAVAVVAPVACGRMAQEKFARLVVATKPSAAPPAQQKTARREAPVVPAPPRRLKERTEAERAAREGKVDGARVLAAKRPRPEAPSAGEAAAKRRKSSSSSSKKPAAQAAHQRAEPAAKQQPLPNRQRAAPTAASQSPISKLIEKGKEALKRRRQEEIARAREKFRQELLEVEKAAMPDETIYPEELEELGLTELQYAVTRMRKQAQRRRLG